MESLRVLVRILFLLYCLSEMICAHHDKIFHRLRFCGTVTPFCCDQSGRDPLGTEI